MRCLKLEAETQPVCRNMWVTFLFVFFWAWIEKAHVRNFVALDITLHFCKTATWHFALGVGLNNNWRLCKHFCSDYHAKALCKQGASAIGVVPLMCVTMIAAHSVCLSTPLLFASSLKALLESPHGRNWGKNHTLPTRACYQGESGGI